MAKAASSASAASAADTISVREAAQRLKFTMKYVYDLVWAGKIKARKINGQWRVSVRAVESRASSNNNGNSNGSK